MVAMTNNPRASKDSSDRCLLLGWVLSGLLAVLVPILARFWKIRQYERWMFMNNMDEYQNYQAEQYQYQQEQYQQQYQQGGQYNNYGGDYDVKHCMWYQWTCNSVYMAENGELQASGMTPGWFSGWSMSQRQRERMLETGENSPGIKFAYCWQLFMFVAIHAYGAYTIAEQKHTGSLIGMLLVFANMSFISMWLLADGSIYIGDDEAQAQNQLKGGFYQQMSVLAFMTEFWYTLFGFVFIIILGIRQCAANDSDTEKTDAVANSGDYKSYEEKSSKNDDFVKV